MRRYVPPDVTLVPENATQVFQGVIYDVYQWQQEMFDGSFKTFEMIKRPDTVIIIGILENKIIISREEQPHIGSFLALPAGMHDVSEEDELQAAKREMREETGHIFKNWKLIYTEQLSEKIERINYTFLATDLETVVAQELDVGEKIEPVMMTLDEVKQAYETGEMRFYPSHLFDRADSLDELLLLPPLFDYGNEN